MVGSEEKEVGNGRTGTGYPSVARCFRLSRCWPTPLARELRFAVELEGAKASIEKCSEAIVEYCDTEN